VNGLCQDYDPVCTNPCQHCVSDICVDYCLGTNTSCGCEVCIDCTNINNSCGYNNPAYGGYCLPTQRPSWYCDETECKYTCVEDPSCGLPCSGSILLTLSPSETTPSSQVEAIVSNLSNCNGDVAYIKQNSCSNPIEECNCSVSDTGCSCNFTSPSAVGTYTYYACIDKDGDNEFDSEGEQDNEILLVTQDTTPPITTINPDGHDWTNQDVDFELNCSDSESGCNETYHTIISSEIMCPDSGYIGCFPPCSSSVTCSENNVCNKGVCFYSKDNAGNIEEKKRSNPFLIDKTKPYLEILSPEQGSLQRINFTLKYNITDSGSGLDQCKLYTNSNESGWEDRGLIPCGENETTITVGEDPEYL
jgi:hypothetical protein